ncbi:MAG: hypothetical protein LBB80_03175 [Treponema sp.]|jgi:membrane protein implicated in regulation of membrane protease activity|nr:hypothetical protein [Treponema sp.]
MEPFLVIYGALTLFGLGITVADFCGILDQKGTDDGDTGEPVQEGELSDEAAPSSQGGSWLAPGDMGVQVLTKILGCLRTGVYFSLGAGPTGLFALFLGHTPGKSLIWSAGVGVGILFMARLLRKLLRRDLDSSLKPSEFIMEKAIITVPVAPGAGGKAVVRQFGKETELYVRSKDPRAYFAKGAEVQIVDFDESWYYVIGGGA